MSWIELQMLPFLMKTAVVMMENLIDIQSGISMKESEFSVLFRKF